MRGILIVSHSAKLAEGLHDLLQEIVSQVPIHYVGGLETGEIGTTYDRIMEAAEASPADELYVFYDLGSAKMNLEMVQETLDKTLILSPAAMVEGAFVAATLIRANADLETIEKQLKPLSIK